MFTKAFESKEI